MDVSLADLAVQTVAYLKPLLVTAGGAMVQDAVTEGRKALWAWLKGRLTRAAAQETLAEIEAAPEDEASWKMLEACLEKALKDDAFREALASQMAQLPAATGGQHAEVTGDHAVVAQIQGSGNSVDVSR